MAQNPQEPPADAGLFDWLGRYKKAVLGAVTAGLIVGAGIVASPSTGVTGAEWIELAGAIVGTGGVVGAVTNKQ